MKKNLLVLLVLGLLAGCAEDDTKNLAAPAYPLKVQSTIIADELEQYVGLDCNNTFVKVRIGFDNSVDVPRTQYEVEYVDGKFLLNGKEPSEQDIQEHLATLETERKAVVSAKIEKRQRYAKSLQELQIVNDEATLSEFIDGNDTLNIEIDACDLERIANLKGVLKIEEYNETISESLVTALQATGVTSSLNLSENKKGENVGVYMAEHSQCPPTTFFNNYRYYVLNGVADGDHARLTTYIVRAISQFATIFCKIGCTLPTSTEMSQTANVPYKYISSYSCGTLTNDNYTSVDAAADDFIYEYESLIVKSAGNQGATTGYISSPGKAINALTVGNYNDHSNTPPFDIYYESNYVDPPNTNSMKPEVCAPGSFITFDYCISGTCTQTGTSFASPHVSGMLANYLSSTFTTIGTTSFSLLAGKPHLLKLKALIGATHAVSGGSDKTGLGGVMAYPTLHSDQTKVFNYDSFDDADAVDALPNNGKIDIYTPVNLANGGIRAGIAWLVRGSYTQSHLSDSYPIGASYSIKVYNPNGLLVASSVDYYNNFVIVQFNKSISGQYHIVIEEVEKRDANLKFRLAFDLYRSNMFFPTL